MSEKAPAYMNDPITWSIEQEIKVPLRAVKAWVSKCLPIMIFMMGGAGVSIVMTDHHMILLSYYELLKNCKTNKAYLCILPVSTRGILLVCYDLKSATLRIMFLSNT